MRRTAIVLTVLALAGCASSENGKSATVTFFGPGTRLESWKVTVVEGAHLHPSLGGKPCPVTDMMEKSAEIAGATGAPRAGELGRSMASAAEGVCASLNGKAYGGRDRVAILLIPDAKTDEAVVVDLPRLRPGETDRVFRTAEFSAAFERPVKTTEALLERGWVRAFQPSSGGTEFELFLVLKPVRPGATYESVQVVTRVDASGR